MVPKIGNPVGTGVPQQERTEGGGGGAGGSSSLPLAQALQIPGPAFSVRAGVGRQQRLYRVLGRGVMKEQGHSPGSAALQALPVAEEPAQSLDTVFLA